MKVLISKFQKDESGATMIEYGLIAALISVAVIAMLSASGTSLVSIWTAIQTALASGAG